jgi:hypothetical protein
MDPLALLALSFTTVGIMVSLGWAVCTASDTLHNWHKERLYRNRPRGATRRTFK